MIRIWIILFFISFVTEAANISDNVVVKRLKWDSDKKMYRLTLYGKAGLYYSSNLYLKCIGNSLRNNKEILISYDAKKLIINNCTSKQD